MSVQAVSKGISAAYPFKLTHPCEHTPLGPLHSRPTICIAPFAAKRKLSTIFIHHMNLCITHPHHRDKPIGDHGAGMVNTARSEDCFAAISPLRFQCLSH